MPPTGRPITAGDQLAVDSLGARPDEGARQGILLASIDGSIADPAPIEFGVGGAWNMTLIVNVSAISGAGATLTVNVEAFDRASGAWVTLLTSVGIVATGRTALRLGSSISNSANVSYNGTLHEIMRVRPVKSGTTTTLTYGIGVHLGP